MSLVFVFVCLVVLITNTFKFVTSQINLVLLHVYLTVKPKEMTYANMADHCRPTENWVQNQWTTSGIGSRLPMWETIGLPVVKNKF